MVEPRNRNFYRLRHVDEKSPPTNFQQNRPWPWLLFSKSHCGNVTISSAIPLTVLDNVAERAAGGSTTYASLERIVTRSIQRRHLANEQIGNRSMQERYLATKWTYIRSIQWRHLATEGVDTMATEKPSRNWMNRHHDYRYVISRLNDWTVVRSTESPSRDWSKRYNAKWHAGNRQSLLLS